MNTTEGYAAVVGALRGAGLRVATRPADLTPPTVYAQLWAASTDGVMLAGGRRTTVAVFWVPIRGLDDPETVNPALDSIFDALDPIVGEAFTMPRTSITIGEQSFDAFRGEAVVY